MKKPFFSSDQLSSREIFTLLAYVMISCFVWYYMNYTAKYDSHIGLFFSYALGTQFFIYLYQYKALRKWHGFLFWLAVGLVHFYIFIQVRSEETLQNPNGHASNLFRNTLFLLLLIQAFRYLSLRWQGKELVCPTKGKTDIFMERSTTFMDANFFLVYLITTLALIFIG
jgi:hypothetical protein